MSPTSMFFSFYEHLILRLLVIEFLRQRCLSNAGRNKLFQLASTRTPLECIIVLPFYRCVSHRNRIEREQTKKHLNRLKEFYTWNSRKKVFIQSLSKSYDSFLKKLLLIPFVSFGAGSMSFYTLGSSFITVRCYIIGSSAASDLRSPRNENGELHGKERFALDHTIKNTVTHLGRPRLKVWDRKPSS